MSYIGVLPVAIRYSVSRTLSKARIHLNEKDLGIFIWVWYIYNNLINRFIVEGRVKIKNFQQHFMEALTINDPPFYNGFPGYAWS